MKFYAAVTLQDLTLSNIENGTTRVFPAGTAVSATEAYSSRAGQWHLNANGGGGTWDTYHGYAAAEQLQLGEILARVNE
jgi:hypothetical protein